MKKLLLIAAVASMSAPAFASKARVNALGNAAHLIDTQTVFNNPAYLSLMGDYATFEAGKSTNPTATEVASSTALAEGGFVRSAGDAKYMAYLGRKSDFTSSARPGFGFLGQDNPIELQYAMKGAVNWGVGLNYSSSDKKSTSQKQSSYGVRVGASSDMFDAYAVIGLGSEATGNTAVTLPAPAPAVAADTGSKYKGTTGFKVGGGYKMENLYPYLVYYQDGFKFESANNAATYDGMTVTQSQADIGIIDHNKIEGGQWFYGVAYRIFESKRDGAAAGGLNAKTNTTSLPFLIGVEYDAASWVTLRASATQNVLLGSTKTESTATPPAGTQYGETDTIANNTTVAAGAGLKFNKWVLDGSASAATSGDVNTTNFLTNVALTYNF